MRFALLGWWVALGAAPAQPRVPGGAVRGAAGGLRHARFYGIASSRTLNHVNRNDAKASLKVWFDELGKQNGFVLDSKVDVADDVGEIRERLESHTVDILVLDIAEYLELESSRLVVPVLTHARDEQGRALYPYVLLANPASPATALAGLRGKNALVSSRDASNAGLAWMDVLLAKEKLGRAASFFASLKIADKPQACILPVFFGAADACVVDEIDFELARELNPQVGRLRVLERSRPMIESLVAMPAEPIPYAGEIIDAMLALGRDPRGRQLLSVFKTGSLVRIHPGDLDAGRELWRDYYRLPGSLANRPAGFAAAESDRADRGRERY